MNRTHLTGIVAYGGYVPRLRLSRRAVVEANSWFNPAIARLANRECGHWTDREFGLPERQPARKHSRSFGLRRS